MRELFFCDMPDQSEDDAENSDLDEMVPNEDIAAKMLAANNLEQLLGAEESLELFLGDLNASALANEVSAVEGAQIEANNDSTMHTPINPKSLVWEKKNLILDEEKIAFKGSTELPTRISDLESPYELK